MVSPMRCFIAYGNPSSFGLVDVDVDVVVVVVGIAHFFVRLGDAQPAA